MGVWADFGIFFNSLNTGDFVSKDHPTIDPPELPIILFIVKGVVENLNILSLSKSF